MNKKRDRRLFLGSLALLGALFVSESRALDEALSLSINSAPAGSTTTATVAILNPADVESLSLELSFASGATLTLPASNWFNRGAYFPSTPFGPSPSVELNHYADGSGRTRIYIDGFGPSGISGEMGSISFNVAAGADDGDSQVLSLSGEFWSRAEQTVKTFLPVSQEFVVGAAPVIDLVSDVGTVNVPEGGTSDIQFKLSAQPVETVNVNVARTAGDSDISVQSGAALSFTTANWNDFQTVTLAASEDDDASNGSATITASSADANAVGVTATEIDNDTQSLTTSTARVNVPEGATASFGVKLSAKPSAAVQVTITRTAGDANISVQSGGILNFDSGDWNAFKMVTLAAAEDGDEVNGEATLTVSAPGLDSVVVTAAEVDNDVVIEPVIFQDGFE